MTSASANPDNEFIRNAFRHCIRRGILLAGLVPLFHGAFMLLMGENAWALFCLAAIALGFLAFPSLRTSVAFPLHLLGVTALALVALAYCTVLAFVFGSQFGFHYVLIVMVPLIMVAGRIGLRVKWLLVVLLMLLGLGIELSAPGLQPPAAPVLAHAPLLRGLNAAAAILLVAAVQQYYFVLMASIHRRLSEQAAIDPLTGLFNRRKLLDIAGRDYSRLSNPDRIFSVILADLDHFKSINDIFGHDVGDGILKHASKIILATVRETDVVCRWGGEEFLILLPETAAEEALAVAERIRGKIAAMPATVGEVTLNISITLGIAQALSSMDMAATIKEADNALYAGKAAGRNRTMLAAFL